MYQAQPEYRLARGIAILVIFSIFSLAFYLESSRQVKEATYAEQLAQMSFATVRSTDGTYRAEAKPLPPAHSVAISVHKDDVRIADFTTPFVIGVGTVDGNDNFARLEQISTDRAGTLLLHIRTLHGKLVRVTLHPNRYALQRREVMTIDEK